MTDDPFLLRAIIDADQDMMWAVDAERLALTWWNQAAERYMGDRGYELRTGSDYTPEERTISRSDDLSGYYRRALDTGPFKTEIEWTPGVWTALEFTPLLRDGRPFAVMGVARDITEARNARARLEESEARYRLLARNMADVIFTADPDTLRFTYVSPSCSTLDGFEPEELIGREMIDLVAPIGREARRKVLHDLVDRFRAGSEQFVDDESEVKIQHKDGSTSWAEVRLRVFPDPVTSEPTLLGITRDRSRERAAEDAAREKQQQLDRFFSLDVGLLSIFDIDGRLRVASAGWERTLGYCMSDLTGVLVWDFVHPDDLPAGY